MVSDKKIKPLIVIVGQTASGKTDFAIKLARFINGEIICADSRTIYKEMDIGTAKPSRYDQSQIKHHLIDLVRPDQNFSVSEFKNLAERTIEDIQSKGKMPILVGGSGLYVDSVIYDYKFRTPGESTEDFSKFSIEEMQNIILELGLKLPENKLNPRHLANIIQSKQNSPVNKKLQKNIIVVGLNIPIDLLKTNITNRTNKMIEDGLIEELKYLVKKYGYNHNSFQIPSYKALLGYINNENDLQESIQNIVRADLRLAKKQSTWFKRNKSIHWMNDPREYVAITTSLLNKLISSK